MYIRFKWRLVAFVTVVLYVLLVFLVVRLLVHNFVWAVAFGLTGALLLYAAWRAVASRGRLLLLASLLAFVLECVLFLRDRENIRRLIAIAIVAFVYVGLVNILSRVYWRTRRHVVMAQHKMPHFRKPVLIINPKAGNGRALKAHIHELALAMDIKVFTTSLRDGVEVLAHRAVFEGADVLGVSGGDGSIGAAAKVALENDLPLIVLPGGTRCHFARDLGLDPKRIVDALASYHGVERHIDVADINQRIFLNNASFGLYADIVDHPAYRKHKFRVSWETMRALASGTKDLYDLRFHRGGHWFHKAAQVLVGVNRYNLVDIFEFGHRERLDEGVLQVVAITQLTDAVVTDLLRTIDVHKLHRYTDGGEIYQWTSKSFTITNDGGSMVVGVDGEREVYATPVTVRIKPRALRVYVPAEGVRARPEHPFSTLRARRIWRAAIHPTN